LKDVWHFTRGTHGLDVNDPRELDNNFVILGEVVIRKDGIKVGGFPDFDSFIRTISPRE
jgi:hypothetical protein